MSSPKAIWHVILMVRDGNNIRRLPIYQMAARGHLDALRRAYRDLGYSEDQVVASRAHLAYDDGLLADGRAPCKIANWQPEDLDAALT